MKKFKDFIPNSIKPILVKSIPVHGKHSHNIIKENEEYVDIEKEDYNSIVPKNNEKHVNDLHEEFSKLHKYSKKEINSIKKYTDDSSINEDLINKFVDHSDEQVKGLDNLIKNKKLHKNIEVYHGTGFDPDEYASKHPERHIELPSYTSTSLNKRIGAGFAELKKHKDNIPTKHVLKIHLNKGDNAAYIGKHSYVENEKEMLLPRNLKLKISDNPVKHILHSKTYNKNISVHIWDAHPIKEEE